MQRIMLMICLLGLISGAAIAQTAKEHRGQGYGFIAPGVVSDEGSAATLHFGVGGEGLVYKGLGVGGEVGYLHPARGFSEGFGIASANGSYHFREASASGKLVPFVTGGYSLFFRSDTANAVNFGGGINYWAGEHVGVRLEVRDHILTANGAAHYVGFRIGFAFR